MRYSTSVINKLWKIEDKSLEETIKLDILNFIRTIHSNGQKLNQTKPCQALNLLTY